jgi:hypothetical protein
MNVPHLHRIPGRVVAGGLLLAAMAYGAVVAGPAALASSQSAAAGSAQTAGAGIRVTWSLIPASATAPDQRSKFSYTNVQPGSVIYDHVAVVNRSSKAFAFSVYATDATGTTAQNVLLLMPGSEKPRDIGSWVTFPKGAQRLSVIIPAGKGYIEPFKIAVPRHATPGDHTGGVIAAVSFTQVNTKGQVVTENQRIAVPLELRVAGQLRAGLQVESISTGFHGPLSPFATGKATVSYTVVNTGNVRLTGSQSVSVTGPFGISSKVQLKNLPTVLPGDAIRVTAQPAGLYPAGPMTARVRVTPGLPLAEPAMTLPAGSVNTASLFAVPWPLLLLLLLIIGSAVAGYVGRGWWHRQFRARLDAAAESARLETERRLLGNKSGTSGPQRQA